MGTQIRIASRAKYKMLSVVLECFSTLQVKIFCQLQACTHTFHSVLFINMVEWGKMGMVGQSRSLGILFCMPKIKEPMMKRSTFSFFHWSRKSKIGDTVIISSLPFTPETKMSLDSLYPPPYSTCPTLPYCIFYLLESKFYFVVLNHFCDSWLKIDGLCYFAKSGNIKVTSSENIIILTRPSLVLLTYSQDI